MKDYRDERGEKDENRRWEDKMIWKICGGIYREIIIDKRNENLQKSDTVEKDFSTKKSNKIQ